MFAKVDRGLLSKIIIFMSFLSYMFWYRKLKRAK